MKSVMIGMPCFGGLIHAKTSKSVMLATQALDAAGIKVHHCYVEHESLIQRARNTIAHEFLKSEAERLVFIDADIIFQPETLVMLLMRNEDVVGGAYPKKRLDWDNIKAAVLRGEEHPQRFAAEFVVNAIMPAGADEAVVPVKDGCLLEVAHLATGFLNISRNALLKMAEAYPESIHKAEDPEHLGEALHAFFDCGIVGERYLSEDYYFCHRWRQMGGQCWLHLGVALGHIGVHAYAGDLLATFQPVQP